MPKVCPVCGAMAVREEGESAFRCIGIECSAKLARNIIHFVSREAMNIKGLGENIIQELLDKKLINNIADIYFLKQEDFESLKKDGKKFASNLIEAINISKKNEFERVLTGLGINHIGVKAAKALAKRFKNIDNLINAEFEEINMIEDFGEIMAKSVYEFFKQEQTIDLINRLKEGKLADLAPTMLEIMGLEIPAEMTGESLLED